ncbi:hypothetical protein [Nitrososphaera sp.]|uniref:hypothetical protein n=1 Tax=Nitrososphaera sp. TaxID=1971748 RepID=UPI00307F8ECE
MTSGKYFNKGVSAKDRPYIGHVVRETEDKIVVFGDGDERYDILKTEIKSAAGGSNTVAVDLPFYEIVRRYRKSRKDPLPTGAKVKKWLSTADVDLASYEKKYPNSLFNKGVRTQDEEHVGHVMKETADKIVVFGHYDYRFDVPKSKIIAVGRNVILGIDYGHIFKYRVDRNAPLPGGAPVTALAEE